MHSLTHSVTFCSTTLDYEVDQMYDFIITATDRGLGSRHNTPAGHVIINVTDVNDNDPMFDPTEYSEFSPCMIYVRVVVVSCVCYVAVLRVTIS